MDTHKHSGGRLRMHVEAGPDRGRDVPIPYQGARRGRAASNDIELQDPTLSRHHCQLFFKPGSGLWVRDLESANGTLVNDQEVAEARLKPGDTLSIGDTIIRIQGSEMPDAPDDPTDIAEPSPPDPDEMPRAEIPGFELHEEIGQGAMATVWKARQESLDRTVAIKILRPDLTTDESEVEDFISEARAAAKLVHPNVVQVYDAAQYGKTCYIVMEYVEGETLGVTLREKGAMPPKDALRMFRRVAEALDQAWNKAGIVHRDIKPDNIIVDRDGTPKVADLGLAKIADPATLTAEVLRGALEGTPNYMSPEQARGDERIDCRSDMYSFGATLYHALTGKMPFADSPPLEVADKQITGQIPNPRNVEPSISLGAAQFISRLMMKDPAKRFDNWKEVLGTLRKIQVGGMILGKQTSESISTIAMPITQADADEAPDEDVPVMEDAGKPRVPILVRIVAWAGLAVWFLFLAHNRLALRVSPGATTGTPGDEVAAEPQPARPYERPYVPPPTQITPPPRQLPARPMPAPAHPSLTEQVEADRQQLTDLQPQTAPNRLHELRKEEHEALRAACRRAAVQVTNHQFLPAYETLGAAAASSTSRAYATEIERARSLVLATGRMNQTIAESIRNRIGKEVKIYVNGSRHRVMLHAMSGNTVNGSMVHEVNGRTVTNAVLFKISSLDPIERSRWVGPASTPEKCAMKYLLYLERGDHEMALQFAQNCGHFSETFAELAEQRMLGGASPQ